MRRPHPPLEAHHAPPLGGPSTPPFARPSGVTGTRATYSKPLSGHAAGIRSTPVKVVIDGKVVADGPQQAQALALIGVDEETVDNNWFAFFSALSSQSLLDAEMVEGQHGMGWDIEVNINADGITEVKDLAYIDPRTGERTITYRVRQYDPAPPAVPVGSRTLTRGSHVVTKTEPIDLSGALGASTPGSASPTSTRRSGHSKLWRRHT